MRLLQINSPVCSNLELEHSHREVGLFLQNVVSEGEHVTGTVPENCQACIPPKQVSDGPTTRVQNGTNWRIGGLASQQHSSEVEELHFYCFYCLSVCQIQECVFVRTTSLIYEELQNKSICFKVTLRGKNFIR